MGVQGGGGVALQHDPRSASVFTVMPRVGYVFYEPERGLPGSFEIVVQPSYLTAFQKRTAHVGGVASLLKYNLRTGTNFTPFAEGGAGISYATIKVPRHGTNFNFILQIGVGLQYAISDRHAVSFQWLYHHLSNADTSSHNPGLNTSLFLLGFSTLY
jgi:opacity protein-like surface antigen